jgi:hypothetical protein
MERKVGVLKVDVEGGELDVFRAMVAVLEKNKPLIISEVLPVGDPASEQGTFRKERQDALLTIFRDLGYRIIRLHIDGSRELLDDIEVHSEIRLSNYLFVPAEKVDLFAS